MAADGRTLPGILVCDSEPWGRPGPPARRAEPGCPTDRPPICLSPDQFQVVPLQFSKNLDTYNPNTPEWREDVGLVVTSLLAKVCPSPQCDAFPALRVPQKSWGPPGPPGQSRGRGCPTATGIRPSACWWALSSQLGQRRGSGGHEAGVPVRGGTGLTLCTHTEHRLFAQDPAAVLQWPRIPLNQFSLLGQTLETEKNGCGGCPWAAQKARRLCIRVGVGHTRPLVPAE